MSKGVTVDRQPAEGDKLILLPDGIEYRIDTIGVWSGAERFKAVRVVPEGFEQVESVTLALGWDDARRAWKYSRP